MKLSELLHNPGKTLAYYPALRKIAGTINAALLLSQLLYWHNKQANPDGWIYKRATEAEDSPGEQSLQQETGLSYAEQRKARAQLRSRGLLHERYRRSTHRLYFQVDIQALQAAWEQLQDEQMPPAQTASTTFTDSGGQLHNKQVPPAQSEAATLTKSRSLIGTYTEYTQSTAESTQGRASASSPEAANASFPIPLTPLEAVQHPDIRLFERVCGRIPALRDYGLVVETMRHFRSLKGKGVVNYLRRFWLAWSGRRRKSDGQPYDPGSLTWLTEWALNDQIPAESGAHNGINRTSPQPERTPSAADLELADRINRLSESRPGEGRLPAL